MVTGLQKAGLAVPEEVEEATVLTSFAWESRYPGLGEPVTENEYREAIQHAGAVVAWAAAEIEK